MASNSPARGKHRRPRRSARSRPTLASVAVLTAAGAGSLSGAASADTPSSSATAVADTGLAQAEGYQHNLVRTFSTQVIAQQTQAEAVAKAKAEALARAEAAAEAKAKAAEAARQRAAAAARAKAAAAAKAAEEAKAKAAAEARAQAAAAASSYADDLDGWIRHALAIMQQHGIPGTYDGIYRNVMRESSGNPNAVNLTDSNATAGTPSQGLLQVIQPTFEAYHIAGTSWSITDPVANIVAACNYAYHQYGSIDNVNSAY
ncbi:transglycosylase SLT domain-containing protein [Streptomyces sp. RB6PN25]|uniref:Transglycosylase SLT domain-containing protein n=1 Tax=Streptomyces humicola TaxID=2953240 RepID=A0ABT1Q0T4_9ACTN|nr:transglycosylase SLT domain-containing protein [Streptomyces humicola]MCQ4083549.1 transglycosylase SLT domain-containing protein [Streptomyces humicola]